MNITTANLYAINSDNSPQNIIYRVSGLDAQFKRDGVRVQSFTQKEINLGKIQLFGYSYSCNQIFYLMLSDSVVFLIQFLQ